jgi:hypothetical protein
MSSWQVANQNYSPEWGADPEAVFMFDLKKKKNFVLKIMSYV